MTIGLCEVEIHLSEARSLKEKRMVLNRIKGRLRSRLNVSVAEVEHQDLWQRATLAVVTVAEARTMLEKTLQDAISEVERHLPGEVLRAEVEILA